MKKVQKRAKILLYHLRCQLWWRGENGFERKSHASMPQLPAFNPFIICVSWSCFNMGITEQGSQLIQCLCGSYRSRKNERRREWVRIDTCRDKKVSSAWFQTCEISRWWFLLWLEGYSGLVVQSSLLEAKWETKFLPTSFAVTVGNCFLHWRWKLILSHLHCNL